MTHDPFALPTGPTPPAAPSAWIRIIREVTAWQRERLAEQDGAVSY